DRNFQTKVAFSVDDRQTCAPLLAFGEDSLAAFSAPRIQSGISDIEALYCETRPVPGVHFLLHENSRISPRGNRHAKLLSGVAAIRTPDGSHIGGQRLH